MNTKTNPQKADDTTEQEVSSCIDVVQVETFNVDIPQKIVKLMQLNDGSRVVFTVEGPGRILFRKV